MGKSYISPDFYCYTIQWGNEIFTAKRSNLAQRMEVQTKTHWVYCLGPMVCKLLACWKGGEWDRKEKIMGLQNHIDPLHWHPLVIRCHLLTPSSPIEHSKDQAFTYRLLRCKHQLAVINVFLFIMNHFFWLGRTIATALSRAFFFV